MLRLAVIALVALNLVLVVLEASKPPAPEAPDAESATGQPPLPDAPGIVLLGELAGDGAAAPGSRCFTLGPFDAGVALGEARRALDELADAVAQREAEALVAALDSDAENLFLTLTASGLCGELRIIARVHDPDNARKFRKYSR